MSWNRLSLADIVSCSGHVVTVDVETTGLSWWSDKLIGVGVHCPDANVSGYFPTLYDDDRDEVKEVIKTWRKETQVVAHNLKFEAHFLDWNLFQLGWKIYDTAIMVHLLDSRYSKSLEKAEKIFLGTTTKADWIARAPKKLKKQVWNWPLNLVAPYCINDCVVEHKLFEVLTPMVEESGLWKLFLKDLVYLKEIWQAERTGLLTDPEFLERAYVAMIHDMKKLEEDLYDGCGQEFNWRSPKQMSQAIYGDLGVEKPENPFIYADKGDTSKIKHFWNDTLTSTFILEKGNHPLKDIIINLRESKVLKQDTERWIKLKDHNNILHPSFNVTGTRTGRLSCRQPNVQNVASEVRTRSTQTVHGGEIVEKEETYNLRKVFISPPGMSLISTDFSQMEMRMFGILSQDNFLLSSLNAGRDIHGDIAEKIWGNRDKLHREWAKTISFGLIYGMSPGSLKHRLNITYEEGVKMQNDYFKTFPKIKQWLKDIKSECRRNGYVEYWSGRRWYEDRENMLYVAANAVIQGGCADYLSICAIRLGRWLREYIPEASIVNFVHDELIIQVPDEAIVEASTKMQEIMNSSDVLDFEWKTHSTVGKNWGSMTDLGDYEYSKDKIKHD